MASIESAPPPVQWCPGTSCNFIGDVEVIWVAIEVCAEVSFADSTTDHMEPNDQDQMGPIRLLQKHDRGDFLSMIGGADLQLIMEADVESPVAPGGANRPRTAPGGETPIKSALSTPVWAR